MKRKPNPAASARKRLLEDHLEISRLSGEISKTTDAKAMLAHLTKLKPLLERHFKAEEAEFDGLHAGVRKRTPEQTHALEGLELEHGKLLEMVGKLRALAAKPAAGKKPAAGTTLRKHGSELHELLCSHEARENEIFLDSIWNEVGEGD